MVITPNPPLLYIDNVTMNKAVKDPAMKWLSKNWESLRDGVYIDDSTFRIDLETRETYKELTEIMDMGEDITTIYINFSSRPKRDEFLQVFLNRDLEYGISKKYGDMGTGRVKQTTEYKKRLKLMDGLFKTLI